MRILGSLLLVVLLSVRCSDVSPTTTPSPKVDLVATLDAAVAATRSVERELEATATVKAESNRTAVPTSTPGPTPAPTEVGAPTATEAPEAERDSGDEVTAAVQRLFDTWNQALRDEDAELFRSVLTRELAASCRLDDLQSWFDQDEEFLTEVVVRSVFVDVADPSRAFAEITTMQDAGRPEESPTYPWPVAREDGGWRAGFLYGLTVERCPYSASIQSSGSDGGERVFPQIPGLDLERREDILAAVPGTRVLHGSFRTEIFGSSFSTSGSMSDYSDQVSIYAELKTDSAAAELVRLYRDGLKHPSWDILNEGSSGDFGWFSWTVLDGDGRLWQGKLVVAPSHEGWKHVWLSLYSGDSDDSQ